MQNEIIEDIQDSMNAAKAKGLSLGASGDKKEACRIRPEN